MCRPSPVASRPGGLLRMGAGGQHSFQCRGSHPQKQVPGHWHRPVLSGDSQDTQLSSPSHALPDPRRKQRDTDKWPGFFLLSPWAREHGFKLKLQSRATPVGLGETRDMQILGGSMHCPPPRSERRGGAPGPCPCPLPLCLSAWVQHATADPRCCCPGWAPFLSRARVRLSLVPGRARPGFG